MTYVCCLSILDRRRCGRRRFAVEGPIPLPSRLGGSAVCVCPRHPGEAPRGCGGGGRRPGRPVRGGGGGPNRSAYRAAGAVRRAGREPDPWPYHHLYGHDRARDPAGRGGPSAWDGRRVHSPQRRAGEIHLGPLAGGGGRGSLPAGAGGGRPAGVWSGQSAGCPPAGCRPSRSLLCQSAGGAGRTLFRSPPSPP